jgi:hypothetical protein
MNNEPVAWMQIHYKDKMCVKKLSPVKTWEDDVPLYLHPVDAVNISQEYVDKTQNNRHEPVAWIEPITESVMKDYDYQNNLFANETGDWIPLYTHPVKELTVFEIMQISFAYPDRFYFARAILRKAQENG